MNKPKMTTHRVTMPDDMALEYLDKLLVVVNKQFLDPGFPIALSMAIDKMRPLPDNKALTVEELAAITEPTPLWIEHLDSNCSVAAPGEWLIYKPCVPTRVHPYFCFGDKALCAYYYEKGWLAYRHPPEKGD